MPDSVDPLHDYSISLLLPLTLKGFKATDNSNQDDLHNHLRSLVLQCPNKLLDQSKTIRNTSSEPQNSKIQQIMLSEDEYTDIPAKIKDCPQGRRPALGRKRARFSLKPKTSQPSLPVDISLNIDQLQDPEEFYSAFEKHENAKKELQKQRGEVSVDSSQPRLSSTTERRRPGMLGKTGGYKHRYALAERFESFVPSQETQELDSSSPLYDSSNKDATSQVFQTDSVASEETNQTILDKLICTDLAGDGAVTLLQEYLQIKPINVEELSLPEMESLCKTDFKALDHFTGPRKALSDIHNVVQGLNSEKHVDTHNQGKTSDYPLASPPPSKSPLSYLPMLKRRSIMQIDPPTNPFSFRGIELSPAKQHSYVKVVEESGPSPDLHASHDDAVDCTPMILSDKPELGCEGPTMDNLQDYMDPTPNESHIALHDKDEDMQQETMTLSGEPELGSERLTMDNLQGGNALSENSDPAVGENHTEDDHPKIISSEENNESLPEPPTISSNVESEQNAPSGGSRKRRELVHRKSLAGAGTACDSGVRKSTRIKSRPLEYWKGECLLYASHDDAVECTRAEADGNGLTSSGKFQFMRISGDNTGSSNGLGKMVIEDFTCPLESIDVNSSDLNIDMDPMANESHGALQDKVQNEGLQQETMTLSDMPELGCEGPIMDNLQDYMDPTPNESHTALHDKDEDMQQETMTLSGEPELGSERLTMDNLQGENALSENSDPAVGDNHTEDDHPSIISSEENNESLPEPPTILSNVESKQKAPAGASRKRRELVHRKSLAGAGTAWDSGVRKSTRIKSRPLEYWKGERFLYGRVHESLLTVIGLKYESPEKKSGKPTKKVKYFVSDEHKALVDLQALH